MPVTAWAGAQRLTWRSWARRSWVNASDSCSGRPIRAIGTDGVLLSLVQTSMGSGIDGVPRRRGRSFMQLWPEAAPQSLAIAIRAELSSSWQRRRAAALMGRYVGTASNHCVELPDVAGPAISL